MTTHPIAVLKFPRNAAEAGAYGQSIVNATTKNPALPTPTPPIATIEADITALDAAQAVALTRAQGAAELRNVKLLLLRTDLEYLMAYVQQVADASPTNAEAIILGAGYGVKGVGSRTKGEIEVKLGPVSGSAHVIAKAVAHRASYDWQYSVDQKTWTNVPTTLQANTMIAGLIPATSYFFRFRAVTKAGVGNWSQVAAVLMA